MRNGAFNPIERAAAARPGMIGPLQTTRRRIGEVPADDAPPNRQDGMSRSAAGSSGRRGPWADEPFSVSRKAAGRIAGHAYADSARTLGQMSASGHSPHRGRRASQISLPSMIH